jgi:crotonobetainyl-CoA:carnitine CoA-transferase CaiB-like acyl-CoA transferase
MTTADRPTTAGGPTASAAGAPRLPLEGIRIVDLTVVWAGPYATMQLADWGAEVIRVESRQHFAPSTRGFMARPPQALADNMANQGFGLPDDLVGEHPWNRQPIFNDHARNKLSMTVDLNVPEGQEVLERLVRISDGVIENNLPPNIEKQGITWERLSRINPQLVLLRIPAFGLDGPYRGYRTFGNHMEALAGHPVLRAYPGLGLDYAATGVPSDAASGVGSAFAFLMGLRQRRRTGKGLQIELATAENFVPLIGEFVMDYTMNGRVQEHLANTHPTLAPHNVYRCAGHDRWVAIAVRSEEEWQRFCSVLHAPELSGDPRFATMAGRHEHREALDAVIGRWTASRDAYWVAERLQQERIPAGVVMHERDVLENRQLEARGFWQPLTHPDTGTQRYQGTLWEASETPVTLRRHAPRLGEDNEYVYRQLLGCSDEEYRQFEAAGHIGMEYAPDVV